MASNSTCSDMIRQPGCVKCDPATSVGGNQSKINAPVSAINSLCRIKHSNSNFRRTGKNSQHTMFCARFSLFLRKNLSLTRVSRPHDFEAVNSDALFQRGAQRFSPDICRKRKHESQCEFSERANHRTIFTFAMQHRAIRTQPCCTEQPRLAALLLIDKGI